MHHRWTQTAVTVRKRSIWVKIADCLSRMTLQFDEWPWNTIEHLFRTTSSYVHHFKTIREFKLELKSGNAQFGAKSAFFLPRVTLKFHGWPWKTIGHLFYTTSSFGHDFRAMGELKLKLQFGEAQFGSKSSFFVPCDVEIWRMILKNNRAPVLCCLKLCASFHSHAMGEFKIELQSGNAKLGSKSTIFRAVSPWNLTDHLE